MRPLCVDLDGTLIASDVLEESLLLFARPNPLRLFQAAYWFCKGRPSLKKKLGELVDLDPRTLPYHEDFLDYLRQEHRSGRPLILVTASDEKPARAIAEHVGIFQDVMASDGVTNLRSHAKAAALIARFGTKGFDYAGNSFHDLPVWAHAHTALAVETPESVVEDLMKITHDVRLFRERKTPTSWMDFFAPFAFWSSFIAFLPMLLWNFLTAKPIPLEPFILVWVALMGLTWASELGADLVSMRSSPLNPRQRRRFLLATGALDLPKSFKVVGLCLEAFLLCALFIPLSSTLLILGMAAGEYYRLTRLGEENPSKQALVLKAALLLARLLPGALLAWSFMKTL